MVQLLCQFVYLPLELEEEEEEVEELCRYNTRNGVSSPSTTSYPYGQDGAGAGIMNRRRRCVVNYAIKSSSHAS